MPTSPPKLVTLLCYTSLLSYLTLNTNAMDFPRCNAHDKAVLLRIRDHFGGPNGHLKDWSNDTDCCFEWNYVGCGYNPGEEEYGRINGVTFSRGEGLSGSIPSDFGDLPYLSLLIIAENINVTGTIPVSLTKLKKLDSLDLGSNRLTGPIPEKLLELKTLKEVDLSGNQLSGEIPSSISSLPLLSKFNVSHNKLSGSIPKLPKSLKSVDVSYNQLCGKIPSGLSRFGAKSFVHNKCLCGAPLSPCK